MSGIDWELVIFDCDGVLVDSEFIANRVFAEVMTEMGLPMTAEEAMQQFMGRSMTIVVLMIEERLGRPVPQEFVAALQERTFAAFRRELRPVPNITWALDRIPVPVCVASSGDRAKMQTTLGLTGLLSRFEGCLFSATDVERGKPFPDLFLYAAQRMGVVPERCAEIEDAPLGVKAGVAAGMRVFGYARISEADTLATAGAELFYDMRELPRLLGITEER
jgi:HAD superfamily hydrolase (TIGR01509 family)